MVLTQELSQALEEESSQLSSGRVTFQSHNEFVTLIMPLQVGKSLNSLSLIYSKKRKKSPDKAPCGHRYCPYRVIMGGVDKKKIVKLKKSCAREP